jgi:hypothetical protein
MCGVAEADDRAKTKCSRSLLDRGRRLGAAGGVEPLRGLEDGRATSKCWCSSDQGRRPAIRDAGLRVAGIGEGGGQCSCASSLGSPRSRAGAPRGGRAGGGLQRCGRRSQRVFAVFPIWTFGKPGPLFSGRFCPGAQCK